jgi:hypothetical protein
MKAHALYCCCVAGLLEEAFGRQCCGGEMVSATLQCCGHSRAYTPRPGYVCCGHQYVPADMSICCGQPGNEKVRVFLKVKVMQVFKVKMASGAHFNKV